MAKDIITGVVVETVRARSSQFGNPAYRVTVEDEHGDRITRTTAANASIGYAITNREYRETSHSFEVNAAGRITREVLA